jgi:YHS domain-containing protein
MADLTSLLQRIDAEVNVAKQQAQTVLQDAGAAFEQRKRGFESFLQQVGRVREIAKPRLEALAQHFKFDATPKPSEHEPGVELCFDSELAKVNLKLAATHDAAVKNLYVDYDLRILPIFIKFEPHSRFEAPIDALDEAKFEQWLDDRLVDFAKTYLEIQTNSYYQKDHLVTDPVAQIQFPKIYTQVTAEKNGQKYYFINESTRDEFLKNG